MFDDNYVWTWLAEHRARFPSALQDPAQPIRTVDMFRYCHLLAHGGLILDLDFYCLKPVTGLLSRYSNEVVLGSMLMPPEEMEHSVPNAWMYSAQPEHPLWLVVLALAAERMDDPYIERATGPILLWDSVHLYMDAQSKSDLFRIPRLSEIATANEIELPESLPSVVILPPDYLYSLSWGFPQNNRTIQAFRDAESIDVTMVDGLPLTSRSVAFTYWSHSWGDDPLDV